MTRSLPLSSRDGKKRESNGHTLWGELKKQGYDGSERTVYRFLETLKQAQVKTVIEYERLQKFSASTAIWLFIREQDAKGDLEQEDLSRRISRLGSMLTQRWQGISAHPGLPRDGASTRGPQARCLVTAGRGQYHPRTAQLCALRVERDKAAVQAGLTQLTNNGMVEGFVTKVKLIKRQGYGRASFPLRGLRVLHAL